MSPTYWDEEAEIIQEDNLRKLQFNRLQKTVNRAWHHLPYYRRKMSEAGLQTPYDLKSLSDLSRLPFTSKRDLREVYPFGAIAEPMKNIIRIHSSSGTTGTATVVGYTQNDIRTWSELMARTLAGGGINEDDRIQIAFGYGLFTGGLGVHYGAEKLGATVIPMSSGNTLRQIQILKDFNISVLCCTPSYALYLAEVARDSHVDLADTQFRIGIFGAEPWSEEMRSEIERQLPIQAYDIYGLSEVIGPGVAFECEARQGLHVNEDHFIPEVIDPISADVLPPGTKGELVFTTITKEGTPVIRYRTGDISSLIVSSCSCGRTMSRIERVASRTDDMLIIRGVNVYPSQIESVLLRFKGIEPHYQIIVSREHFMDTVDIHVEISSEIFSDEVKSLENLKKKILDALKGELHLSCTVKFLEPKSITRSEGKAKRVIDLRKEEDNS